jgi:hypothetical protein
MRKLQIKLIVTAAMFLAVAGAGLAWHGSTAEAGPPGSGWGMYVAHQYCLPDGTVEARVGWSPSYWGIQYVDMSSVNDGFYSSYSYSGPHAAGDSYADWHGLRPGATYYIRVNTYAGSWLPSDTWYITTIMCAPLPGPQLTAPATPPGPPGYFSFTPPTNLQSRWSNYDTVRLSWQQGSNNNWFCIDTALTLDDLMNYRGSWRNHHCGLPSTWADLSSLPCGGVTFFWRIWASGTGAAGHSAVSTFVTPPCAPEYDYYHASIKDIDIYSSGGDYYVRITAGLPNGCHHPHDVDVDQDGYVFDIDVINRVQVNFYCDYGYDTYDRVIRLGDLEDGKTYTVWVNGEKVTFTAD